MREPVETGWNPARLSVGFTPMFEVFQNEPGGKFHFRLKSPNGETILASEAYDRKAFALNGIQSVKVHAGDLGNFEVKPAASGRWHFILRACNGQVIGSSQLYADRDNARLGISAVTKHAPGEVRDLTA
jgi:uncharacterized protein YegP (UPF0339 family)